MASGIDISQYVQSLQGYEKAHLQACIVALGRFTEHCLADATILCPISDSNPTIIGKRGKPIQNPNFDGHPGFLRSSDDTGDIVQAGEVLSIEFGFNTPYAAPVEENLDARHPQGQAKYMFTALQADIPLFPQFLQTELAKVKN